MSDETKIESSVTTQQDKQTTTTAKKSQVKKTTTRKSKLNIKKLEDGVYSISGKMLKTDKKTESMANEAINHKIKLTSLLVDNSLENSCNVDIVSLLP